MGCIDLFIIKIDCDQDQTIKVDTTVLNTIMNSVEQSAKNEANTGIWTVNVVNFTNNGTDTCGFQIYQGGIQNTDIVNSFTTDQIAQINTQISDGIKNAIAQQELSGLAAFLTQSGDQSEGADLSTTITNAITNSINQSVVNEAWNTDTTTQIINVVNNGLLEGDSCTIVQQSTLNIRVTNLANNLQSSFQDNKVLNDVLTYAKQDETAGSFAPLLRALIIGAIIIVALIVIGAVIIYAVS